MMGEALAAMVLVAVGVTILWVGAIVAWCFLRFLLVFWPAIVGITLALKLVDAGMNVLGTICLVGGIGFNVLWWLADFSIPVWLRCAAATSRAPKRPLAARRVAAIDHRIDCYQQMLRRAEHVYGGRPTFFFHAVDDMSAVAIDPEAGKMLLWTDHPGLLHVLEGQEIISARVETTFGQEPLQGQRIRRIDLQLQLRHPLHVVHICFFDAADGKAAVRPEGAMREARAWEGRIDNLRVHAKPPVRLVGADGPS